MIDAMNTVWANYQHKGGRLLLMLALANYANQDGMCWPSVPTLARDARLKERQARTLLQAMHDDGDITILTGKGPHGANLYHLNLVALRGAKNAGVQKMQGAENAPEGCNFRTGSEREGGAKNAPKPSSFNHHINHHHPEGAANAAGDGDDSLSGKKSKPKNTTTTPPSKPSSKKPLTPTAQRLRERGVWAAREFEDEPLDVVNAYLERVGPDHPAWLIVDDLRAGLHRTPAPVSDPNQQQQPAPTTDIDTYRPEWFPLDLWAPLFEDFKRLLKKSKWDGSVIVPAAPQVAEVIERRHADRFAELNNKLREVLR